MVVAVHRHWNWHYLSNQVPCRVFRFFVGGHLESLPTVMQRHHFLQNLQQHLQQHLSRAVLAFCDFQVLQLLLPGTLDEPVFLLFLSIGGNGVGNAATAATHASRAGRVPRRTIRHSEGSV